MIKKTVVFLLALLIFIPFTKVFAAAESKISIDMHYLVVSPGKDGSTNIMNMVNYTNSSTSEYRGDGKSEAVLKVTLPEGAEDLNFLDNKTAIKQAAGGFITTDPFPASQSLVLPYSYRMPKGKNIKLIFDYPVQLMQVLVPEGLGSVEFKGADYTSQGNFTFEGQKYSGYSVESIKENQVIMLVYNKDKQPAADTAAAAATETDKGKTGNITHSAPPFHNPGHLKMWAQSPLHRFNPHIVLSVLLAIIIAGIFYYSYFRRKERMEAERVGADEEEQAFRHLIAKQKAIMDRILELEETHDHGGLPEDEYQAKLQAYKHHLVQVKLNLRKFIE